MILFACFSKCLWNKCCQVEEKSEMTTFLKFKVKSRYLLELGVRRSKGRDGCWPLGWEQCVDKESITQCLLVSGNKTGCGVMVERTTWWRWKASEVWFKRVPLQNGGRGSPGGIKTLPVYGNTF